MNCGLRPRLAGGDRFSVGFSGQRVGIGRTDVKAGCDARRINRLAAWALKDGRSYVSDGTCHLMDFRVESVERTQGGQPLVVNVGESELRLDAPQEVVARVKVIGGPAEGSPRSLKVEAVLNGYPHDSQHVFQDGSARDLVFKVPVSCSSWLAFRGFSLAHTNPIFFLVGRRPIRAATETLKGAARRRPQCLRTSLATISSPG